MFENFTFSLLCSLDKFLKICKNIYKFLYYHIDIDVTISDEQYNNVNSNDICDMRNVNCYTDTLTIPIWWTSVYCVISTRHAEPLVELYVIKHSHRNT